MAEQSSTVATFRAFVMLTCILLIPLAAVCGTSFPSVVKAIQNGRLPTLADFRGPSENVKSGLSEAPRFAGASTSPPNDSGLAAPNSGHTSPQPGATVQPSGREGGLNSLPSSVVPVNYEVPIAGVQRQSTSLPQNLFAANSEMETTSGGHRIYPSPPGTENQFPHQSTMPAGAGTDGAKPTASVNQMSANGTSNPDATFNLIQDRLKQLGASYYLLEAWGDRKDAFRFYCQMAIGGNSQVKQSFQNVDRDPLKAMSNVLEQVEDWRKRR